MKIAVVDDLKEDAHHIRAFLERFQSENHMMFEVRVFLSSFEFLEKYRGEYDIIFLDIEMPGSNGLEVAREIRSRDQTVGIIFITGLAQYAINGYEVRAIDFIVKPVGYYNFSMKLEKAFRFLNSHKERDVLIHTREGILRVTASDILYIEKNGDFLVFHNGKDFVQARGSIRDMKEKLRETSFAECNAGCLINMNYVRRIEKESVILTTGERLPLSRRLKKSFTQEYIHFMGGA